MAILDLLKTIIKTTGEISSLTSGDSFTRLQNGAEIINNHSEDIAKMIMKYKNKKR